MVEKKLFLPLKCSKDNVRVETVAIDREGFNIRCPDCGIVVQGVEAEQIIKESIRYLIAKEHVDTPGSRFVVSLKEALVDSFYDSVEEFIKPDFGTVYIDA
ncbi:MAG: hypothetical protein OXF50_23595 [Caldilineaceae bacterium]|nr:hypothetical protein [Caldilineaceae bacterium]